MVSPVRTDTGGGLAGAARGRESARSPNLKLTTSQLDAIRSDLESGIRSRTGHAVRAVGAGLCLLADFPRGALVGDGDLVAGVVVRFDGPFSGTAIAAMEPEDAYAWVKAAGDGGDPVAGYVALVGGLLAAAMAGWGGRMELDLAMRAPALHEDSVAGILLGTHAPSGTLILSLRLELDVEGESRLVHVYVLMDSKLLQFWAGEADATPAP